MEKNIMLISGEHRAGMTMVSVFIAEQKFLEIIEKKRNIDAKNNIELWNRLFPENKIMGDVKNVGKI